MLNDFVPFFDYHIEQFIERFRGKSKTSINVMYSVPGFNMDFPVYRTIYLNISKLIYQAKLPLAEKYNCGTVIGQMKK